MILIFHTLYFLCKYVFKYYYRRRAIETFRNEKLNNLQEIRGKQRDECNIENLYEFNPPICKQRYLEIQQILLEVHFEKPIKKIVEFGCSDLSFFEHLKRIEGIEEVLEVDIDERTLEEYKFKVQPTTLDYLQKRSQCLNVQVLCGSITDCDYRLTNTDAVVCIEFIQYQYPDVLEALPHSIFGYIKPQIVIITTPNADFNILFPGFRNMRHREHKFEFTRAQFKDWALNIVTRYNDYTVTFKGIGYGPTGTESVGACTQVAVFLKQYDIIQNELVCSNQRDITPEDRSSYGICSYFSYTRIFNLFNNNKSNNNFQRNLPQVQEEYDYYKEIYTVRYPSESSNNSIEENLLHWAVCNIYTICQNKEYFNTDTKVFQIPLHDLMLRFQGILITETQLREILKDHFRVEQCIFCDQPCWCVILEIDFDAVIQPTVVKSNELLEKKDTNPLLDINGTYSSSSNHYMDHIDTNYMKLKEFIDYEPTEMVCAMDKETPYCHWSDDAGCSHSEFLQNEKLLSNKNGIKVAQENITNHKPPTLDNLYVSSTYCNNTLVCYNSSHDQISTNSDNALPNSKLCDNVLDVVEYKEEARTTGKALLVDIIEDCTTLKHNTFSVEPVNDNIDDVNCFSREVLFDPNSEIDMLEDIDTVEQLEDENNNNNPSIVLVRLNINLDEDGEGGGPFPNWLLNLLGHYSDGSDAPHFYSQGDGLGVHPSIVQAEENDAIDVDSDSSSDHAEAETLISEFDGSALSDDINLDTADTRSANIRLDIAQSLGFDVESNDILVTSNEQLITAGNTHSVCSENSDEFYDTLDG